jgi:hypothetical protein
LETLSSFILRPSIPPRPATQMGIVRMVDYTRGHTTCTRKGIPTPLFSKRSLTRTSAFGLSSMPIGMSPSFSATTT